MLRLLSITADTSVVRFMRVAGRAEGFALIDVMFVAGIVAVLSILALPRLLLATQSAGAASAIGSLRSITSAELSFALTCGAGFYAPNLTTLGTPPVGSKEPFIGPSLGRSDKVTRANYLIQIEATPFAGAPASCNGLPAGEAGQAYKAGADALDPANLRFFATNANGLIFEHTSSLYAAMPEVGDPPAGQMIK